MEATSPEPSIAAWKKELVDELQEKFEKYPVVGILDITGIPAPQFQQIRDILREDAEIKVSRRVLLRIAIEKASEEMEELKELKDYLVGQSALIFTEMDPFRLWKVLENNRTSAPAKVGMEAPEEIVIPAGETDFDPGPVISELQQAGIQARIEAGSVVIQEDSKVVEEGEPITQEKANVLSRFGIETREIGFKLNAAYSDETVFSEDMLVIDEEEKFEEFKTAYSNAYSLSVAIDYPTRENVGMMIGKASSQAQNLALNSSFLTSETAPQVLSKTYSQMFGLATAIASVDADALGEELQSELSSQEEAKEAEEKAKKEKEQQEKEAEENIEEEEEEKEEGESQAGLGGLFD